MISRKINPLDGVPFDSSFVQVILCISQLRLIQQQLITKGIQLLGRKIGWCAALVHICALQHYYADHRDIRSQSKLTWDSPPDSVGLIAWKECESSSKSVTILGREANKGAWILDAEDSPNSSVCIVGVKKSWGYLIPAEELADMVAVAERHSLVLVLDKVVDVSETK